MWVCVCGVGGYCGLMLSACIMLCTRACVLSADLVERDDILAKAPLPASHARANGRWESSATSVLDRRKAISDRFDRSDPSLSFPFVAVVRCCFPISCPSDLLQSHNVPLVPF